MNKLYRNVIFKTAFSLQSFASYYNLIVMDCKNKNKKKSAALNLKHFVYSLQSEGINILRLDGYIGRNRLN